MSRRVDHRLRIRRSAKGTRTDRVKKAERDRMVKLWEEEKTIEGIAATLKRSERTVSKQLKQAQADRQRQMAKLDPLMLKRKEQHFDRLAAIVHEILTIYSYLEDLRPSPTGEYLHGEGEEVYRISRSEVSEWLQDNVNMLRHQGPYEGHDSLQHEHEAWPRLDLQCFEAHLREELADHDRLRSKDFALLVKENPYELIEKLRILSRTKVFKGKCPTCPDL